MCCRIHLGELEFEVLYKKKIFNHGADPLSRVRSFAVTTVWVDTDIAIYLFSSQHVAFFGDTVHNFDKLLASAINTPLSLVPVTSDEIKCEQDRDGFCPTIRSRLGDGTVHTFQENVSFRSADGLRKIVMP